MDINCPKCRKKLAENFDGVLLHTHKIHSHNPFRLIVTGGEKADFRCDGCGFIGIYDINQYIWENPQVQKLATQSTDSSMFIG